MERERIYRMFDKSFSENKDTPIALYGIGINTKYLLEMAKEYNIIGIVANDRIGEFIYEREIMSIEDVEDKVKIIIIVAQMKSVKIIYDRIKYVEKNGIDIYDIWGEKVSNRIEEEESKIRDDPYWNSTFAELKSKIDKNDIISFDLFDTLIMRKVLNRDNILDIIEEELKEEWCDIDFKIERNKAEKQLVEHGIVPTIEEIYNLFRINTGIDEQISNWLIMKEMEKEVKCVVKRQCIAEALEYAIIKGKEIYLLADTYLSSKQIYELLLKCSIKSISINNVIVSSEIKKIKSDVDLFGYFIKCVKEGTKLYIGTGKNNNIEMAQKFGIDTYCIMSAYELFLRSSVRHIIRNAVNINDEIILGLFVAKAFNNPFALSESKGKLQIRNLNDLGYYCFAPITIKFLSWCLDNVEKNDKSIILFSSRDGYFLYELYESLRKKNMHLNLPKGIYFYISRRAITVANIKTEYDIICIVEDILRLSVGNLVEILEQRLGIMFEQKDSILSRSLTELLDEKDKHQIVQRVLEYKDSILENASKERLHFLIYIQRNNLLSYKKIYLFDLYTKGTSFCKLVNLINAKVELLCYAVKDFPNKFISTMENVKSMFGNIELLQYKWFERSYQLFEVVYASSEGQLRCFDGRGIPEFIENSEYNYSYLKDVQRGILEFMSDFETVDKNYYSCNTSLNMVDSMSKIMTRKESVASEDIRKGFTYYDSFASESKINIWDRII